MKKVAAKKNSATKKVAKKFEEEGLDLEDIIRELEAELSEQPEDDALVVDETIEVNEVFDMLQLKKKK